MSQPELQGVPLNAFVEPIYDALNRLMEASEGKFRISGKAKKAATQLELTPDKSNSARSTTTFKHLGGVAGELVIIAFKPGDGTGNESTFKLKHVDTFPYPAVEQVVPRSKLGIYSEVHFPVATAMIDSSSEILGYAGNLELLGLPALGNPSGNRVSSIGHLGQREDHFRRIIEGEATPPDYPIVTETLWYERVRNGSLEPERNGDPHAVINGHEDVIQVCGFMAIRNEAAAQHASFAQDLYARPANQ